ncbi:MAG TPA: hypothetical protein DD411_17155 [Alcanivorax sp.]|nr:hypothetical protein [Alcanivorax sp.]HBM25278.1 hypothetical protein [Alcanivorax sp.]
MAPQSCPTSIRAFSSHDLPFSLTVPPGVQSEHDLRNIFRDFELERESVVAKNATTAADGKIYQVEHFNLDAIISVGYRVNSHRATRFRQWATTVLRHHLTRGYSLNEHRLARQGLSELEQAVEVLG